MTQRGLILKAPTEVASQDILTSDALALLAEIARAFGPRLRDLLRARDERQARLDDGSERLDFLASTQSVRDGDWRVAAIPADLLDRRVEITGPTDRKMILNALASGAQVFMADFEDSNAPTWKNLIEGQRALMEAVRGTLSFVDPGSKKSYAMPDHPAVLIARPRGLHLVEKHLLVDGTAMPASFFDTALYILHNAKVLLDKGSGPYLYLPKMESHKEARLWNDVFVFAQQYIGV
ncbi:MAG TPA: malate synthase A, partial [Myxococcota bacterium]